MLTVTAIKAQKPNYKLIQGFYQGHVMTDKRMMACLKDEVWGNCVTIAIIKTATSQFGGFKNIFSRLEKSGEIVNITFDDGVAIELSQAEIDTAKKYSGFKKIPEYTDIDSVELVYAAICKRILVTKSSHFRGECVREFRDAVFFINSGYPTKLAGKLLGLTLKKLDRRNLSITKAAIIHSGAHTAFCSYGFQDKIGQALPVSLRMYNVFGIRPFIAGRYTLSKKSL